MTNDTWAPLQIKQSKQKRETKWSCRQTKDHHTDNNCWCSKYTIKLVEFLQPCKIEPFFLLLRVWINKVPLYACTYTCKTLDHLGSTWVLLVSEPHGCQVCIDRRHFGSGTGCPPWSTPELTGRFRSADALPIPVKRATLECFSIVIANKQMQHSQITWAAEQLL